MQEGDIAVKALSKGGYVGEDRLVGVGRIQGDQDFPVHIRLVIGENGSGIMDCAGEAVDIEGGDEEGGGPTRGEEEPAVAMGTHETL